MKMTYDGYIITTKRKYKVQELFELMQGNLQEKFGTMSIVDFKDKSSKQQIFVNGADDFYNLVYPSAKYIIIEQVEDREYKERLSVAGTAANITGAAFNKVIGAMGPEIGAVTGLAGGVVGGIANTVGTVGRVAKFASEKKKRDNLEGNWGVLKELATEIEKLVEVKTGGCYIATCIYGSYDCPEVWTLRRYRDSTLSASWLGRQVIRIYYTVSPKVVECFGNKKWFNRFWKPLLDRFVRKLHEKGIDSSLYSD